MQKIISIFVLLILSVSCVSTTKLLLVPTKQHKKFLIDGRTALESKKTNSHVKLSLNNSPKDSESKDGRETYLWISVTNLSKTEFIFDPSKNVKITRLSDNSSAEVLSYKDLLNKLLSNEKTLKTLDFVSGVLGGTTHYMLQNESTDKLVKNRKDFLKKLFKPTTLFLKSEVEGLIAFLPKKLPDNKIHNYSIEVTAGQDKHLFSLTQKKK